MAKNNKNNTMSQTPNNRLNANASVKYILCNIFLENIFYPNQ